MTENKNDYQSEKTKHQDFFNNTTLVISWGVKISCIVFICIIALRIANADFSIDILKNFDFNDLLSLALALFAMYISILFYFKSTESSNKFYSDTYTFTKNISESIGRIDERFGERLRHLDESYGRIENRIYSRSTVEVVEKEKEKEKVEEKKVEADNELTKANKEYEDKINDLLEKAKLNAAEKNQLITELKSLQEEKERAASEVQCLQRELSQIQGVHSNNFNSETENGILGFLHRNHPYLFKQHNVQMLYDLWREQKKIMPNDLLQDMYKVGFIDAENNITPYGHFRLSNYAKISNLC